MTQRRFHRLGKDGESLEKGWKWIRQRFRERPLSSLLVAVGLLFLLVTVANTVRLGGTGFEPKTLWDWMALLLVPLVLAIGGWWLNKTQKDIEREQAEQQAELERETLEQYFDRMTELLLGWDLRKKAETEEESEVQSIARSSTLAVLRKLGANRKGDVIQFLYESKLISNRGNGMSMIDLDGADLSGANLINADLSGADLSGTKLKRAYLLWANLAEANLSRTDLSEANMLGVDLSGAHLSGADLSWAILMKADLRGADVRGADLIGADLENAAYNDRTMWPDGFDPNSAGAILVDEYGNPIEEPDEESS